MWRYWKWINPAAKKVILTFIFAGEKINTSILQDKNMTLLIHQYLVRLYVLLINNKKQKNI